MRPAHTCVYRLVITLALSVTLLCVSTLPSSLPIPIPSALAYEFVGSTWSLSSGGSVPYRVNFTLSADIADGPCLAAIHAGFQSWTEVSCSYMTWRDEGRTNNTGWGVDDQENVVSWRESSWDDSSAALAITSNIFDFRGFIDTDIKYNGFNHSWAIIGSGNARGVDVESVTAHEVGHAVGLDHSNISGATMWPSTGPNDSSARTLAQDDVDGGSTVLYSPVFDLSSYEDALLTYWRWYTNNLGANPNTDYWNVQASNDGYSWIDLELTNESNPNWEKHRFVLSNYMELSSTMQFRFIASDLFNDTDTGSGGSLIEAALDDFLLEAISFESVSGDLNFDAEVNVLDVVLLVNFILDVEPSSEQFSVADINNDSALDVLDVVLLTNEVLDR